MGISDGPPLGEVQVFVCSDKVPFAVRLLDGVDELLVVEFIPEWDTHNVGLVCHHLLKGALVAICEGGLGAEVRAPVGEACHDRISDGLVDGVEVWWGDALLLEHVPEENDFVLQVFCHLVSLHASIHRRCRRGQPCGLRDDLVVRRLFEEVCGIHHR